MFKYVEKKNWEKNRNFLHEVFEFLFLISLWMPFTLKTDGIFACVQYTKINLDYGKLKNKFNIIATYLRILSRRIENFIPMHCILFFIVFHFTYFNIKLLINGVFVTYFIWMEVIVGGDGGCSVHSNKLKMPNDWRFNLKLTVSFVGVRINAKWHTNNKNENNLQWARR